jgi:pyridoxine 5-phosphate synthase
MPLLGVNIDHVATIRQARRGSEPDPVRAAHEAELGGADIITVHLREDRRHIQDHDVQRLAPFIAVRLNLEMAATDEMVSIARRLRPHMCTLVPEGRHEITTEGGLDVAGERKRLTAAVRRLRAAGVMVSAFIDPEPDQIAASADAGFEACEIHTGPYAAAFAAAGGDFARPALADEFAKVADAGEFIRANRMRFHAGHALNYQNVRAVAALPEVAELHIGHAIVSRAVFTGLRTAVADMKAAMNG